MRAYLSRSGNFMMLSLLCVTLVWASPLWAEEKGWGGYDDDNDGRLTFEEVMRHVEPSVRKSFNALDRNHDGVISNEDFDDVHEGMRRMEEWLYRLIKPFLPEEEEKPTQV